MVSDDQVVIYGGTGHHGFDDHVLSLVNQASGRSFKFAHIWHSIWPDGEPGFHLTETERISGRHVVIFSCPTTGKLVSELLDMVIACKRQYGAKTVTVVLSFLRYRRQDRPEKVHEIARLRWFVYDLKMHGADNLVVCEPHSVENTQLYAKEFGLNLYLADPTKLFAAALAPLVEKLGGKENVMIYSPDFGSVERSLTLAKAMGLQVLATPKQRLNGEVRPVEDATFLERARTQFGSDIPLVCDKALAKGKYLIMREDEIDSGGSAVTTRKSFGSDVAGFHFVATHPVCSRGWKMKLFPEGSKPPFDTVWLGNTRPRGDGETDYEGSTGNRVLHVDIEPVMAETLLKVMETL